MLILHFALGLLPKPSSDLLDPNLKRLLKHALKDPELLVIGLIWFWLEGVSDELGWCTFLVALAIRITLDYSRVTKRDSARISRAHQGPPSTTRHALRGKLQKGL